MIIYLNHYTYARNVFIFASPKNPLWSTIIPLLSLLRWFLYQKSWWPFLWLQSWYHISQSSYCNLLDDRAVVSAVTTCQAIELPVGKAIAEPYASQYYVGSVFLWCTFQYRISYFNVNISWYQYGYYNVKEDHMTFWPHCTVSWGTHRWFRGSQQIQWNLSVATTSLIKLITCDFFSNVY